MKKSVKGIVLSVVNNNYKTTIDSNTLAKKLKKSSVIDIDCHVSSFFSDLSIHLQYAFISEMKIPLESVERLAREYSKLCGYLLPLAK